jgi:hypothetical protein
MKVSSARILDWAPRVLAIAFIGFISLFALDVFNEGLGPRQTIAALVMHLLPAMVLTLLLVIAWRREWVGALLFGLAGVGYILVIAPKESLTLAQKVNWSGTIAGPALLVALLFWTNWIRRTRTAARQ